jgi:uncharacterized membrane protein
MIVLAYFWLLALIPLIVEKEDAEIQWHARHGLVLTIAELLLWLSLIVLGGASSLAAIGLGYLLGVVLGSLLTVLALVAALGVFAARLLAIVKGINGGRLRIPGVSVYAGR